MTDVLTLSDALTQRLDLASAAQSAAVERFLDDVKARAAEHESHWRWPRLVMLASFLLLLPLVLELRGVLAGLAYLASFLFTAAIAGASLSLSWASSLFAIARALVPATVVGGFVYLSIAVRVPRTLLGASIIAALPWLVSLAVNGIQPGFFLPSPAWTAMGLWSGLPLICLSPWALVEVWLRVRLRRRDTARGASS